LDENMEDGSSSDTDYVSISSETESDSSDGADEIVDSTDKAAASHGENEEDEEDEVVKAIRNEREKCREHPPDIEAEDFVVDISFHPQKDIIAAATITGDVIL
jgi:hypothetical protein